jgi:hypothetical protein
MTNEQQYLSLTINSVMHGWCPEWSNRSCLGVQLLPLFPSIKQQATLQTIVLEERHLVAGQDFSGV